ncbi:MAG: insulinase family protein, partial [Bacteroidaceae bacterium]|nr:insulinase family protein [Bacteroidaceae bacterium]
SKAVQLTMYSDNGEKYNKDLIPYINIFNEYFGGSMNAIVFQELREARGLAYSAGAAYSIAGLPTQHNTFRAVIGSQNDKMADCIDVFNDIIENMPVSEKSFNLAKDAVVKRYETNRTIGASVLNAYFGARRRGFDHDINAELYNKVKTLTMDDIINFSKRNVAGRKYKYAVLGDENELDMKKLESVGTIHKLTLEDIFGY